MTKSSLPTGSSEGFQNLQKKKSWKYVLVMVALGIFIGLGIAILGF